MRFLMFTGQGSQFVGMGYDLYQAFDIVKDTFKSADKALGFSLTELMFNGPEEKLTLTANAQPAILTVSVAILRLIKSETDFDFDVTAGHSLGEYSSLVATDAMDFEDAVYAVNRRGSFMQEAVKEGIGAMAAIITKKHDEVEKLCREVSQSIENGYCQIANYNAENQVIVSGYAKGVEELSKKAVDLGLGKVIPLKVSAPFHCALMEPVKDKMAAVLDKISFSDPKKPVIENTNSEVIQKSSQIKDFLIEQITAPVRWTDNVAKAVEMGCDDFVEFGPKNVLSSMLKRQMRKANINYVVDLKSYNSYKDSV
ncbi:ACP S-malonyltransferase [Hippea jasoniae]|uniref:ACP S-malonyltransferase n=1 Tax=Hippea jasoniae TaxID=944479 RepID=UPI0005534211|nr:ACP S-malonyltransferase [Hippea jasoniae]